MGYSIIAQPPFDSFTMRQFYNLTLPYSDNIECIYIWTAYIGTTYIERRHSPMYDDISWVRNAEHIHKQLRDAITAGNGNPVILGIKDQFTEQQFNPWRQTKPSFVHFFKDLFNEFKDTKFLIFTSMENLDYYQLSTPNLIGIVPWGGDITNQQWHYPSLVKPVVNKNFNNNTNFISLARGGRQYRAILCALLHYFDIASNGMISHANTRIFTELDNDTYFFEELQWRLSTELKDKIAEGIIKLRWHGLSLSEDSDIYDQTRHNDNVVNFNNRLRHYYKNSFVEFVNETSMTEKTFLITEKTLNSVYGCNFPIFISSVGMVQFLRSTGLDMFDDIVDHSYDTINNPAERMHRAISDNLQLLTSQTTKTIWKDNKHRFLKNVEFVKHDLYEFYKQRTVNTFNSLVSLL